MNHILELATVGLLLLTRGARAQEYKAVPRWGQAAALVDTVLLVQGGRTDAFNSFSYSSAPVTNDVLFLDLSKSFSVSSPPWQYVAGCSDCATSQGPAVAWHTLTPFNKTNLLLFGGDPGPNSPIASPERPDSAALLNIFNRLQPAWELEDSTWAGEPLRRIYHSASTARGKVYMIGGEKSDGSKSGLADHWVFDPQIPSFAQLPTTNGPPDLYGHASVVLPDGRLLVFGGLSPSKNGLIPLSTIWSLDTTKSDASWSTVTVTGDNLPSPRRGFAAALLEGGKVLIQGGADAEMQNVMSDGWILDTSKNPMSWSAVGGLSQVGARRDHFAVGLGSLALFGFGYGASGPANANLLLFDSATGSFTDTYQPPPAVTSPPTTTLPGPSQSGNPPPGSSSLPNTPIPTNGGGNDGDDKPQGADGGDKGNTTGLALGVVFGVLGLVAGTAVVWYINRRRRGSQDSFHLIDGSGDEDSPHLIYPIPVAGAANREKGPPLVQTVKDRIGGFVMGRPSPYPQRRDMLAEEDTRHFDMPMSYYNARRAGSTGSWSTISHPRPGIAGVVQDSLTSLRNVGGAMIAYARSGKSRDPSGTTQSEWEKDPYLFSDDAALMGKVRSERASRPRGGREASYLSQSSSTYYVDPFADNAEIRWPMDGEYDADAVELGPSLNDPPPRSYMYSRVQDATEDVTRLTPLSEKPSFLTATDPSSVSDSSHNSPLYTTSSGDHTWSSQDQPASPRRPSSVIDANPAISATMRRSDSWWSKFTKTPLLDRRSTADSSRTSRALEFRDPQPPPRLGPIQEQHSLTPESSEGLHRHSSRHDPLYGSTHHGRSMSSIETSKTATSEALDRLGHTITIVHQGSHGGSGSVDSASIDSFGGRRAGSQDLAIVIPTAHDGSSPNLVLSPTEMTPGGGVPRPNPLRKPTGARVAARVEAFERRSPPAPPASPPRPRKRRNDSVYGLAPKPSLFVANPDRRGPSGSSTASGDSS